MISYHEALELVLNSAECSKPKSALLNDSLGQVLAESLVSRFPLPRFDNSAVDGYVFGELASGRTWQVVRTIGAGDPPGQVLRGNACARIFTGAPTPPRAATVVMQEDVEVEGNLIRVCSEMRLGQHIRRAGEELGEGEVALAAGTPMNPAGIGLAAMMGYSKVSIHRTPQVGILVTGSELARPGGELGPSQIYESNGMTLTAALELMGIAPAFVDTIDDDAEATRAALQRSADLCDVLVTTGGVSVGDRDVVRSSLELMRMKEVFWKVAMKPGKPVYMGRSDRLTVFGLPGNPLSVISTFALLVKPYLRAVMGFPNPAPPRIRARIDSRIQHKPGRREFVPGILSHDPDGPSITPLSERGSHMLSGMARANSWIDVAEETEEVPAGEFVSVVTA